MKKSYIKILIISIFVIFLCIFNAFYLKKFTISSLYFLLLLLLIIIKFILGFEKDRHRYIKEISLEIIVNIIAFLLIFYLGGLLFGFAKTGNYFSFNSLFKIVIPLVLYIIIKEYLRYILIIKSSESLFLIILVTIVFIAIDNTIAFSINDISFSKNTFLLIALTFIPSITENILCSWISYYFGFKPAILYLLIIKMYAYFLPIVPNPNEYIYSIVFFLLPIIILFNLKCWLMRDKVNKKIETIRKKTFLPYIFLSLVIFLLVYFVSGYFKYYAVAIASGSMAPTINIGDVAIIDQLVNSDDLELGNVIAYNYNGKVIVHRINKLIKKDQTIVIYTKGDANSNVDNWKVTPDMLIGVVRKKIPAIGYPTVWINERFKEVSYGY